MIFNIVITVISLIILIFLMYNVIVGVRTKNHFDVNGLIPLGLAKDATGLNIY